jgi:hypothetical protein
MRFESERAGRKQRMVLEVDRCIDRAIAVLVVATFIVLASLIGPPIDVVHLFSMLRP